MTAPSAAARAAFEYANRGWLVLPIEHKGKRPALGKGLNHASKDPDVIDIWWLFEPRAGVGIVTSPESGLLVVDVDPRSGGPESMRQLVAEVGPLWRTTLTAETGGGGHHLLYRHPGGPVRNGAHVLGRGVDVKSLGYIVAPPSVHSSGRAYRWLPGCPQDPQPVPPALLERLRPPAEVPRPRVTPPAVRPDEDELDPLVRLTRFVLRAPQGERNQRLYWAARRAAEYADEGRVDTGVAESALTLAAAGLGLDEREITATLNSAARAAV